MELAQIEPPMTASAVALRREEERYEWTYQHPMAAAERAKQDLDLHILHKTQEADADVTALLRESSRLQGIQPFMRRLLPHWQLR